MAENAGTIVVTVGPDLDGFRDALMAIADEFEQRITSTLSRAGGTPTLNINVSEAAEDIETAALDALRLVGRIRSSTI